MLCLVCIEVHVIDILLEIVETVRTPGSHGKYLIKIKVMFFILFVETVRTSDG